MANRCTTNSAPYDKLISYKVLPKLPQQNTHVGFQYDFKLRFLIGRLVIAQISVCK